MSARTATPALALVAIGLGMLAAGFAVYLVERDPAGVWLLPAAWTIPAWRGVIPAGLREHLPSFAHAFGFSVLTAACLRPRRASIAAACGGWFGVNAMFEVGQHDAIAPAVAAALPRWFDAVPVLDHVGRYLVHGSFGSGDLAAAALGSGLAGVLLWWMQGLRWRMR